MIAIPYHCSEVGFKKVSFPLTKENIIKESVGKVVFFHTNFMVLTNKGQWAVIRIEKSKGSGRFKMVKNVEVISLPENTEFVNDPTIDVNNPSSMMKIAEKAKGETVVVKGQFEHVSFIRNESILPLVVFDFTPPSPPKLLELVEKALDIGRIRKPIKIVPDILDLNELAKASDKPFVMFPCHIGDSNCGKKVLFLEEAPDISSIGVDNIALIGCDTSLLIFKSLYGKKPQFVNICPLQRRGRVLNRKGIKCITRCDKISEGHIRIGDTAYVSFDPKIYEVEDALLDLFDLQRVKALTHELVPASKFIISLIANILRRVSHTL